MISFKQFLGESRTKPVSVDEFIKWADLNCSKALQGKPIYRGFNGAEAGLLIGNSVGEEKRKSVGGIPNNYTLWIDNHPKFKGYPQRSKSFIATTSLIKADEFGSKYLVICRDDDKVAQVAAKDIWIKKILPNMTLYTLNELTERVLRKVGLHDNEKYFQFQNSLQHLSLKRLKSIDFGRGASADDIASLIETMEEGKYHDMWDVWDKLVTPKIFGVTNGAGLDQVMEGEVWVEGVCGFIPLEIEKISFEDQEKIATWLHSKNPELEEALSSSWHSFF